MEWDWLWRVLWEEKIQGLQMVATDAVEKSVSVMGERNMSLMEEKWWKLSWVGSIFMLINWHISDIHSFMLH
jgi:hypothetical protein